MAEACPQCEAHVDDTGVVPGALLRCDRCGTRFPKARAARIAGAGVDAKTWSVRDDDRGLGIHPALAKKYGRGHSIPDGAALEPSGPVASPPDVAAVALASPPVLSPPVLSPPAMSPRIETRVLAKVPGDDDPATTNPGRPAKKPDAPRAKEAEPVDVPPRIPGYTATELIGKGAMGRVYRATHTASGRAAAIKILAPELAARPDFIARFEREGAAMRAVAHPGVVVVLDQGAALQPDGNEAHYICMEFIDGQVLRKNLETAGRGQALAPKQALRFARKIVQALGAAHARGVIHRDLKPENILVLGPDGAERLVLVDFGLAGILDEENDPHPNLTKSRMTMGTVNYMAPEQRTDAKRVDQRADLYAAGVIFYELLTGDLPLGRFALPTERGAPVPLSVDRCIVRALARNPDERYQYAGQLDKDLAQIEAEIDRDAPSVSGEPSTEQNDTIPGRAAGASTPNAAAVSPERGEFVKRNLQRAAAANDAITTAPGMSDVLAVSGGSAFVSSPSTLWRQVLSWGRWPVAAVVVGTALGLLVLRGGCIVL